MLYNRRVAKAAQEGLIRLECRAIMLYKSKQSDIQVSIACSWGSCERLFLFCTILSKSPGFSPCQQDLFEQTFITPLLFLHNVFFLLLLNIKTITINVSNCSHLCPATKNQFIFLLKDGPVEPCLTSERLMVQVKLKTLIPFAVVSGRASVEKRAALTAGTTPCHKRRGSSGFYLFMF